MIPTKQAATEFLACHRVVVTGVSRTPQGHGGNTVYTRLRDRGDEVFAVNPNADRVEGDPAYHALVDIPGGVDAVVIAAHAGTAHATMRDCVELGITKVWMHRAFGAGSVDDAATTYGRSHGITVIDGGCPLMYEPASDLGHKVIELICARKIPRRV